MPAVKESRAHFNLVDQNQFKAIDKIDSTMPTMKESRAHFNLLEEPSKVGNHLKAVDIIDIRRERVEINLRDQVSTMMTPTEGPRTLPTLLLYDEKGLQLFEHITYLDEYYLTNDEIDLLKTWSGEIADKIPAGSMLVELGSGNLRKVCLLLQAFEDVGKKIDYFALDISQKELERTLKVVPSFKHVTCHGLYGTYDDGLVWLKQPSAAEKPKCILHLGSSIGNFHLHEAAEFLGSFSQILQPTDFMLIGIDSCNDPDKVYHAYNDKAGVTHRFILNGLAHANNIFQDEIFHLDNWRVIGEFIFDEDGGRHQAFVSPIRDTVVFGSIVPPHERIKIEQSLKYSRRRIDKLLKMANLEEESHWTKDGQYGLHMLQSAKLPFSGDPALYASDTLPTLQDWEGIWAVWEAVTQKMIPRDALYEKPIELRNPCIFYLGHIPAFVDIQLTRTTKESPTEPEYYHTIFERGIDPDVDDPEKCHDHSEVPNEWPHVDDIIAYQDRVRERLLRVYAEPSKMERDTRRGLWMGYEHIIMHLETLLYMLIQSDKTLPPPNTERPDFETMARKALEARVPNEWFDIPEQTITIGYDDPEDEMNRNRYFGWDNEKPARREKVHAFQAQGRAITNEEYAKYLYATGATHIPASWTTLAEKPTNGQKHNGKADSLPESFIQGKAVRTVFGPVPLRFAFDWPVFASYDELAGCASWMGGRIPTFEEARSIYSFVERQKELSIQNKLSKKVPAVNGHLINNGVEETPPPIFVDMSKCNVGFKNWHPVPIAQNGNTLAGQGAMGGVWEWTSSVLHCYQGFKPSRMYPGFTADFFDEKHNIILGGSWATHPRFAGRRAVVNFFQRNYPFTWAGARLVRDVE